MSKVKLPINLQRFDDTYLQREIMWEIAEDLLESIEGLEPYQKILFGIVYSLLVTILIRYSIWTPFKWIVSRSEAKWDDELMELATPLFNYAIFLFGIYLTVVWAIEEGSLIASFSATFIVLILMLLTGKFLSKSATMMLPPALEKLDEKADLGLVGATTIITGLTKVVIWGSAILLILAHLEIDITAALASLTIFSLVIGMAMQESASNFIISAQLMLDKPYEVGDKIQMDTLVGTVAEIGFLSTKIRTTSEHLVIVPNKTIASSIVTNFARGGPDDYPRRVNLRLDVTVGYDESPAHVKTILREIIEENELIIQEPNPVILLTAMLDSAINFRINCWVEDYGDEWIAKDQLQTEILERFRDENIEIPYPHMQLKYVPVNIDDKEAKLLREQEKQQQEDKEKRQEEAKLKDAEYEAKLAEERAEIRQRIEEVRIELENEELEEEQKVELSTELLQLEALLNSSEDA